MFGILSQAFDEIRNNWLRKFVKMEDRPEVREEHKESKAVAASPRFSHAEENLYYKFLALSELNLGYPSVFEKIKTKVLLGICLVIALEVDLLIISKSFKYVPSLNNFIFNQK